MNQIDELLWKNEIETSKTVSKAMIYALVQVVRNIKNAVESNFCYV